MFLHAARVQHAGNREGHKRNKQGAHREQRGSIQEARGSEEAHKKQTVQETTRKHTRNKRHMYIRHASLHLYIYIYIYIHTSGAAYIHIQGRGAARGLGRYTAKKNYRQISDSGLQGSMVVLSMPLKLPGGTGTTQNQRGSTQETNREHARNTPETQRPPTAKLGTMKGHTGNRDEAHAKQTGGSQGTAGGLPHKKKVYGQIGDSRPHSCFVLKHASEVCRSCVHLHKDATSRSISPNRR